LKNEVELKVAVFPGDGIGVEVMESALAALEAVQAKVGGFRLATRKLEAGANCYKARGTALPDESVKAAEESDAILLGACGLPDVRYPDGTEIAPQVDLRFIFGLYAGVRPIKVLPGGPCALAHPRAKEIDFILIRESTEGLFASKGKGEVVDDKLARDTQVITRATSERLFDFGFKLAARRKAQGKSGKLTLIDKANVFRSFAFFRKVFDERAAKHPEIATERLYVDACALDFVRRPWDFDVAVTENMFGDILSDLGAGLIGGMGFAPSADIGDGHAVFQPSHGTAPDIMGTGKANPTAMLLSAALMLDWLAERNGVEACARGARLLQEAVEGGLREGRFRTFDMGGRHTTGQVTKAVIEAIQRA
jgi:3-isopropylmalate dehydrogenase